MWTSSGLCAGRRSIRLLLGALLLSATQTVMADGTSAKPADDSSSANTAAATTSQVAEADHPFIDLIDLDGNRLESPPVLGGGQWTLVMIWATDCHICKQQKPVISAFHDAHKDSDARVFGVALDGRAGLAEVHRYLERHETSFPNYVGDYAVIAVGFQRIAQEALMGTPTYLLFDPAGELKGVNPGPIGVDAIERFIARHSS